MFVFTEVDFYYTTSKNSYDTVSNGFKPFFVSVVSEDNYYTYLDRGGGPVRPVGSVLGWCELGGVCLLLEKTNVVSDYWVSHR